MRPENLMKVAAALGVSTDYLLTGDIIDKDKLLLSDKLDKLTPQQVRIVDLYNFVPHYNINMNCFYFQFQNLPAAWIRQCTAFPR